MFGRARHDPAALGRQVPPCDDIRYTPETHPHLTAEVCDVLNTPVGACDPQFLCGVLAMFAERIATDLPPELGLDAKTLFSKLWGQMSGMEGAAQPDLPPIEQPAPPDAEPAAQPLQPEPADSADSIGDVVRHVIPHTALRATPVARRTQARFGRGRPFRHRSPAPRGHSPVRPSGPHQPAPRRLCYAACAGSP